MDASDIVKYCDLMEGVKRRIAAVDLIRESVDAGLPTEMQIEFIYLQYRKILEQIAFGSLISHRAKFAKVYGKFSKRWHASDLLRDVESVNRDYYPVPMTVEKSKEPGVDWQYFDKKGGYLTKREFIELYGRCGDILHERNPYSRASSLDWFSNNVSRWRDKIVGLLDAHVIHLVDQTTVYIVHMQEPDGKVHHYTFERIDK